MSASTDAKAGGVKGEIQVLAATIVTTDPERTETIPPLLVVGVLLFVFQALDASVVPSSITALLVPLEESLKCPLTPFVLVVFEATLAQTIFFEVETFPASKKIVRPVERGFG